VARLFGKILAKLGILKRDDVFVECGRADLVGQWQGHTAARVKDIVHSALGGVLFIDEAYNLVNGDHDDFGMEAVNTLIAEMENKRDRLVVIIAGYTKEIEDFMSANPGLKSRIPTIVEFPDYSLDEMVEIFCAEIKKRNFDISHLDPQAIQKFIEEKSKIKDFGNGRGVRNICDKVEDKQNIRVAEALSNGKTVSDDEMMQVLPEDLCI
jgi:SpoVK/Ycf46/Vps4 family AAA+-type ATPase